MELQPGSLESPYQLPHSLLSSSEKSKCIKEKKIGTKGMRIYVFEIH